MRAFSPAAFPRASAGTAPPAPFAPGPWSKTQALPTRWAPRLQRAFGRDFADVSLETGGLATRFGVPAVTSGRHIHVAPGLHLDSHEGLHVLAHELTHVVQQQHGETTPAAGLSVDRSLEQRAHDVAERVVGGGSAPVLGVASAWSSPAPAAQPYVYVGRGSTQRLGQVPQGIHQHAQDASESKYFDSVLGGGNGYLNHPKQHLRADSEQHLAEQLRGLGVRGKDLENRFGGGDRLYGIEDVREPIRKRLTKVKGHQTVDDVNKALNIGAQGFDPQSIPAKHVDPQAHAYGSWLTSEQGATYRKQLDQATTPPERWRVSSKAHTNFLTTQPSPRTVHFDLDQVDEAQVATHTDLNKYNKPSITGSELRHLYRHYLPYHPKYAHLYKKQPKTTSSTVDPNHVKFYRDGKAVEAPWIREPELWDQYQPKSLRRRLKKQ